MVCFGCRCLRSVCLSVPGPLTHSLAHVLAVLVWVKAGRGAVGLTGGHSEPQRVRGFALPPRRRRRRRWRDSFQRVQNVYLNVSILWRSRRRKP